MGKFLTFQFTYGFLPEKWGFLKIHTVFPPKKGIFDISIYMPFGVCKLGQIRKGKEGQKKTTTTLASHPARVPCCYEGLITTPFSTCAVVERKGLRCERSLAIENLGM